MVKINRSSFDMLDSTNNPSSLSPFSSSYFGNNQSAKINLSALSPLQLSKQFTFAPINSIDSNLNGNANSNDFLGSDYRNRDSLSSQKASNAHSRDIIYNYK